MLLGRFGAPWLRQTDGARACGSAPETFLRTLGNGIRRRPLATNAPALEPAKNAPDQPLEVAAHLVAYVQHLGMRERLG